jgi:hypothetical protein
MVALKLHDASPYLHHYGFRRIEVAQHQKR